MLGIKDLKDVRHGRGAGPLADVILHDSGARMIYSQKILAKFMVIAGRV